MINTNRISIPMQKQTRSLLEELEAIGNNRDTKHIIESRAHNIITSAIKARDQGRFSKSLRKKDET